MQADPITQHEIEAMAERAEAAGQLPLAGILFGVAGVIAAQREMAMYDAMVPFSRSKLARLERLRADRN